MSRGLVFTLPSWVAVLLSVAVWATWSVLVGLSFHRLPLRLFESETALSRLRGFETAAFYERRLRLRAWKDLLPEAGAVFDGGFSKRSLASRDRDYLERFLAETRRAECVHWAVFCLWPVFALWGPLHAVVLMLGYAVIANVPCLLVQRYNRLRLIRILSRTAPPLAMGVQRADRARETSIAP